MFNLIVKLASNYPRDIQIIQSDSKTMLNPIFPQMIHLFKI